METHSRQVQLRDVDKGEYIKRKKDSQTIFIKEHYVREDGWNRYCLSDIYDMNRSIFLKVNTMVWVGFTF